MDEQISKIKRTLLISSSLLLLISIASIEISEIEIPFVVTKITNTYAIQFFIFIFVIYIAACFINAHKKSNPSIAKRANLYIKDNEKILEAIKKDPQFMETRSRYPEVRHHFFKRNIAYQINNEGDLEERVIQIPYRTVFIPEVLAYIKYASNESSFIDYDLPLLWAALSIALPLANVYLTYLSG
ncbi:MAG TPA: hypothetical protein VFF22_04910 [Pseudomonas sp.]|nr:hypothetical protein [Pseudomonas sp.]